MTPTIYICIGFWQAAQVWSPYLWHQLTQTNIPHVKLFMAYCNVCSVSDRLVRCSPCATDLGQVCVMFGCQNIFEPLPGLSLFCPSSGAIFDPCSVHKPQAVINTAHDGPSVNNMESLGVTTRGWVHGPRFVFPGITPHTQNKQSPHTANCFIIDYQATWHTAR